MNKAASQGAAVIILNRINANDIGVSFSRVVIEYMVSYGIR